MRVTSQSLRSYRSAVDEQAELARSYVRRTLDAYFAANPNATTGDAREFCIELLKTSMPNFCDAAGTLAADFFDEMCEAEGIEVTSELHEATDYSIVESKVHYFAERLNENDVEAFKREVVDATHYFVKRSAYDNMVMNCEANGVRYARVPSGFETCPFCFMLASRGFVYHSEATAKGLHGYHDHCDCCIVPGKKGRTVIDGYDPEGMYERWGVCAKTVSLDPGTLNVDARKAIMREVETRDWHWLHTGESPRYEILEGAKPSDEEKETAKRLSAFGFKSVFRPTSGNRTSDVFFESGDTRVAWEFKGPSGNSRWTVNHQFKDASGQAHKLVIDISILEKPESGERWNRRSIELEVLDQIERTFIVPKGERKGEPWTFDEVILISDDGAYCRKFKRKGN